MKILISIYFCFISLTAISQNELLFSGTFQETSALEVFEKIESELSIRFFFKTEWIQNKTLSGQFQQEPLEKVLGTLLDETDLFFLYKDNQVILTQGINIIDNPEINRSFDEVDTSEKGLIFSREFLTTNEGNSIENKVIEIGNRKELIPGNFSTISGKVVEKNTQDPIIGALIFNADKSESTSTDIDGNFEIRLKNGKSTLSIQYLGMKSTSRNVVLYADGILDVEMSYDVIALEGIVVNSNREDNIQEVQMGVNKLNVKSVKNIPIVFGESDIMKVATTLPGVQTIGEGAAGFNVRGGKSDQNLFLLDDFTIYNSSHFFGFFSVFNSDAIKNLEVYKSGMPAKFGGRLSSVFDIEVNKANTKKLKLSGGISPITTKLTIEVPLKKEVSGLLISGRTTYSDWILNQIENVNFRESKVFFADALVKYHYNFSEKDEFSTTLYYSKDNYRLNSDSLLSFSGFNFTNANGSMKWRHNFSEKYVGSFTASLSSYNYLLSNQSSEPNAFLQDFAIVEPSVHLKIDDYRLKKHKFTYGYQARQYRINPGGIFPFNEKSDVEERTTDSEVGLEQSLYFSDDINFNPNFSLAVGVRYSSFGNFGPKLVSTYESGLPLDDATVISRTQKNKGELIKFYHGPEWRVSGRYAFNESVAFKGSYNRTRQYIHVLSNTTSLSPTDIYRISSEHIAPQIADHFALGYYRDLFQKKFEFSIEAYYKQIQNLLDFKTGAQFLLNNVIETEILQGKGRSYGLEMSIKKTGRLNGWINYSFARTFIKLDGDFPETIINAGEFFPTGYDKPHTLNMVLNYKFTRRFSLSFNIDYSTGRPVTFPVGTYDFQGEEVLLYTDRNTIRIPDYLRLDIGFNVEAGHRIKKLAGSYWNFSIYNVLGRKNPYSVFFERKAGAISAFKFVIFGIPIPTISYNFKI